MGIQNHQFRPKVESQTSIFSKKWNYGALWGTKKIPTPNIQNDISL